MTDKPRWKRRALAIEFWLAAVIVAGSFIAGIIGAVRSLTGD
ncbi:hypothetical protein [Sphingopyxis terrae]|nr:hypothetical protein [Sphingopyxis terrae]